MVLAGCPFDAATGKDVHSDRQAALLMNPRFLKEAHYDDIGINLFQFLGPLWG